MTRTLVFGAGGQVAADLIPMLADRGDDLTLVDLRPAEETEAGRACARYFAAHGRPDWESWWHAFDATDKERTCALIRDTRPDEVYHLAALLSAVCERDAGRCWTINMTLFTHVIEELQRLTGLDYRPKLLWPSSIAAFGPLPGETGGYEPSNEYPMMPTTMYGVAKVACEVLGTYYHDKLGVDFRSVRFPGLLNDAEPGGGSSDYANQMYFDAVDGVTSSHLRANAARPQPCFVSPESRIPFMYMHDAVRALVELGAADESRLSRRVYNIKAFTAPSAKDIEASIARHVPGFKVGYDPDVRDAYVASWPDDFDDSPAVEDWGWQPKVDSIDAMTRRLLADIRAKRQAPA